MFTTAYLLSHSPFCSPKHLHKLLSSQELVAKSQLDVYFNGSYKSLVNKIYQKKRKKKKMAEGPLLDNAAKHHYNFSACMPHNYFIF